MAKQQQMQQFRQTQQVGARDLMIERTDSIITCRIDPDSAATSAQLVPGSVVALKDGGANDLGGIPYVDVRTADTDAAYGIITLETKKIVYEKGDVVQVARIGGIIWLEADAALNRGVAVSSKVAEPGTVKAVGSDKKIGITLDKAAAAEDLVRVEIQADMS